MDSATGTLPSLWREARDALRTLVLVLTPKRCESWVAKTRNGYGTPVCAGSPCASGTHAVFMLCAWCLSEPRRTRAQRDSTNDGVSSEIGDCLNLLAKESADLKRCVSAFGHIFHFIQPRVGPSSLARSQRAWRAGDSALKLCSAGSCKRRRRMCKRAARSWVSRRGRPAFPGSLLAMAARSSQSNTHLPQCSVGILMRR